MKQAKLIKDNEDIKPEFWAYAKELSTEMHKANLTQVVYYVNEESDLFATETTENYWDKFFTPKNPKIELLRTACLVRATSQHHYAFIHSSFVEYFLTRKLFENLTANLFSDKDETKNKSTNLLLIEQQKLEQQSITKEDLSKTKSKIILINA